LTSLVDAVNRGQETHRPLRDLDLSPEQFSFFEMVPAELCPKRHIIDTAVDAARVNMQEEPDARFQSVSAPGNPNPVTLRPDPTAVCDSTMREPTTIAPPRSLSTALGASSGDMPEYTAGDSWFTRDSDDWMGADEALGPGLGLDDDDFFGSLHERLLQDLR
jgi:hypothetical protein